MSVKREPEACEVKLEQQDEFNDLLEQLLQEPIGFGAPDMLLQQSDEPAAAALGSAQEYEPEMSRDSDMREAPATEAFANTEQRIETPVDQHADAPPPYDAAPPMPHATCAHGTCCCPRIRPIVRFGNFMYTGPPACYPDALNGHICVFPNPLGPAQVQALMLAEDLPIGHFYGLNSFSMMTVVPARPAFLSWSDLYFRRPLSPPPERHSVMEVDPHGSERGWDGEERRVVNHPPDGESNTSGYPASF